MAIFIVLLSLFSTPALAGWATADGPGGAAFQSDAELEANLTRPRVYVVPAPAPAPTVTECITPRGPRYVGQPAVQQCITAPR